MRVAHEHPRKSAEKWMGCRETLEIDPDRRQYLKNSKRDEEVEDVTNDDEEDMYFEFETSSKTSMSNVIRANKLAIALLAVSLISWGLT